MPNKHNVEEKKKEETETNYIVLVKKLEKAEKKKQINCVKNLQLSCTYIVTNEN